MYRFNMFFLLDFSYYFIQICNVWLSDRQMSSPNCEVCPRLENFGNSMASFNMSERRQEMSDEYCVVLCRVGVWLVVEYDMPRLDPCEWEILNQLLEKHMD